MPRNNHIRDFWQWFTAHACQISAAYASSDIEWMRSHISSRVAHIADHLNWEIGPYNHPDNTFVLTPTVRENLPVTRSAVASSPAIQGWHFLHAKPRKELKTLTFSAHGCTINADNWRYGLTAYNGGEFVDVDLYLDTPIPHEQLFCELVVEAVVGEERRLDQVADLKPHAIDIASVPDDLTAIEFLNDHLDQVLALPRHQV